MGTVPGPGYSTTVMNETLTSPGVITYTYRSFAATKGLVGRELRLAA